MINISNDQNNKIFLNKLTVCFKIISYSLNKEDIDSGCLRSRRLALDLIIRVIFQAQQQYFSNTHTMDFQTSRTQTNQCSTNKHQRLLWQGHLQNWINSTLCRRMKLLKISRRVFNAHDKYGWWHR